MTYRLHIKSIIPDTRAEVRLKHLCALGLKKEIKKISLVDVYTIDKNFSDQDLEKIGAALSNPVTQKTSFKESLAPQEFSWAIEIGFLPGVTDNVAHTAKESVEDLFKLKFESNEDIYTSQITFITGELTEKNVKDISEDLANPLIQRINIKSSKDFLNDKGMDVVVPKVTLSEKPGVDSVDLNISDTELEQLGQEGILNKDGSRRGPLALSLDYLKAIQGYFKEKKRVPTDAELETLAQTWSEHCKHTIFASSLDDITDGIYKRYIKGATERIRKEKGDKDFCVSVFKDNSGGIVFDDDWIVTDKAETHNSPSALDPYGGAITGIVGVNRDTVGFGKGAKPIINKYGYCFGEPDDTDPLYRGKDRTNKMLSAKRIMEGVIEGVKDGGNQSGIPTPQGFCCFDKRFKGKPLVFVGTIGLIPQQIHKESSWVKKARPGDHIVMLGGRVGKDGIHGATFSSEALTHGSPVSAVQIGDPITQKKFSDAIVKEARDQNLYNSITDNGAGGLSSSIGEMAREAGGCLVYLDKVPLKYPGLAPWEIWISESQERMTVSVPSDKLEAFQALMERRGVESTVIGEFTESRKCEVMYQEKMAIDLDLDFLHDGLPEKVLVSTYHKEKTREPDFPCPLDQTDVFKGMLSRYNICDHSFISYQYDYEVQSGSVLKPLQGKGRVFSPTSVTKPVLTSNKGVVLSQGINPSYSDVDTYHMAASAIDTAIRNIIAAGGTLDHLALLDNFCWCDATDAFRLGQLKEAAKACYDYAVKFGAPFISGKDSMFNDFKGFDKESRPIKISVPPTLLVSSIGVVDDVTKVVSLDAKMSGDLVYVLGETKNELSGSEYFSYVSDQSGQKQLGQAVPQVDADKAKSLYQTLTAAIKEQLVASSLGVGIGGVGVSLAKMAIAGQLGMNLDFSSLKIAGDVTRDDFVLFSETQSRFVVTVNSRQRERFEEIFKDHAFSCIGVVLRDDRFVIKGINGQRVVNSTVKDLTEAYRKTFKGW